MPDAAFDSTAASYDTDFAHTTIGRYLRARVHNRLDHHFHEGDTVLELGCGTGEDAIHLAERGVQVIATDASRSMLSATQQKAEHQGLRLQTAPLDLHTLPETDFCQHFDGVFANFGVLNVLSEWQPLAAWLAARLRTGDVAAFGVMAPYCLWELIWHGLHRDFHTAARRWQQNTTFQLDEHSPQIQINYPPPGQLEQAFAPYFVVSHLCSLGLFLPPSDAFGVVEKRPTLHRALIALEERFAPLPRLAPYADHYWIEFRRTDVPPPQPLC